MLNGLQRSLSQIQQVQLGADPEQLHYQTQIQDFCREHPDALYRTSLTGHLTGSAAVVDPGRGAALVMHHVKLDRWLQPGGHADGDANLAQVALREATEETGIEGLRVVEPAVDLDVHVIPERPGEPEHLHFDVRFVVITPPNCTPVGNHESHALAWWTSQPGEEQPEVDSSTQRLLQKAIASLG